MTQFRATITEEIDAYDNLPHLSVKAEAVGYDYVDRGPGVYAWGLKITHRALAERLVRAIEADDQQVFGQPEVRTDVNGRTYVHADMRLYTRHLNKELAKIGY